VAIIGGGLVGMLTAYFLAKQGVSVTIFDKSELAQESSWAGGGILSPLYPWKYPDAVNRLARESQRLYPELIETLIEETDVDPQYWRCGMNILASDVSKEGYAWLRKNDVKYSQTIGEWNRENPAPYLYLPNIAQVRNPRFAKTMKAALAYLGVTTLPNTAVLDIAKMPNGLFKLETKKQSLLAERVVVCAGAWTRKVLCHVSGKISHTDSHNVDIKPVRGQMLLYDTPPGSLSSMILAKGKYIIPRRDGKVLVGSTMEDVGFCKDTTMDAKQSIKAFVAEHCATLSQYPIVSHWSGLRPGSPSGVPYIGEHPSISGLFVNSGHFRNGVILAPASANLMSSILCGNSYPIDSKDYSLAEELVATA